MIKLNDNVIEQGRFPDGTLALNMDSSLIDDLMFEQHITWLYDGDDEMFTIMSLVDMLKRNGHNRYILHMPYLPNARMDRIKSNNENFALKVFCNWLNSLGFAKVYVENVHSNVSNALVDNICDRLPEDDINFITSIYDFDVVFFCPFERIIIFFFGGFCIENLNAVKVLGICSCYIFSERVSLNK